MRSFCATPSGDCVRGPGRSSCPRGIGFALSIVMAARGIRSCRTYAPMRAFIAPERSTALTGFLERAYGADQTKKDEWRRIWSRSSRRAADRGFDDPARKTPSSTATRQPLTACHFPTAPPLPIKRPSFLHRSPTRTAIGDGALPPPPPLTSFLVSISGHSRPLPPPGPQPACRPRFHFRCRKPLHAAALPELVPSCPSLHARSRSRMPIKSPPPRATAASAKRRAAMPSRDQIAANDDAPSIGGLIYALNQKPSRRPFSIAAVASARLGRHHARLRRLLLGQRDRVGRRPRGLPRPARDADAGRHAARPDRPDVRARRDRLPRRGDAPALERDDRGRRAPRRARPHGRAVGRLARPGGAPAGLVHERCRLARPRPRRRARGAGPQRGRRRSSAPTRTTSARSAA